MPLKSGAARIALGAASEGAVTIVPAGLTYEARGIFRSEALLHVAEPFTVEPIPLDERGEPPRTAVKALTERLRVALEGATLQADDQATIDLAAAAEALFDPDREEGLDERLAFRRLLLERAARLRESHPDRLAALLDRVARLSRLLSAARISASDLQAGTVPAELAATALATLLVASFLAPPAIVGLAVHAPAYNLIGPLARKLSRGDTDIVATIKVLGAFVFFPLTWVVLATVAGLAWGLPFGLLAGLALPLCGYLALLLLERWERTVTSLRVLTLSLLSRRTLAEVRAERAAIVSEMRALDALLDSTE